MKHKTLFIVIILIISVGFQSCVFRDGRDGSLPAETANLSDLTKEISEAESFDTWINLKTVKNSRQLGGYPVQNNRIVKHNAILRTGELASLTESDKELLVNEYKLAYIIDLRDEVEAQDNPDPVIEGVLYYHLVVWTRAVRARFIQECTTNQGFDSELYIIKYYTAFAFDPAAIEAYKKMFEVLLENEDGSVLIHCVHGKDRTGAAVTLILSALDVEWEVIENEYLLSNEIYAGSVNISSLRYFKSVIEKSYGSIKKYLEIEIDLNEDDLEVLKQKYTTVLS